MSPDRLFEDYKLRLEYLKGQYDRLWLRFNFFLSIELALFGFLSYLTYEKSASNPALLPGLAGLGVSALWYVVGAQDHYLVDEYRKRAATTAAEFAKNPEGISSYATDHPAKEVQSDWTDLRSWYWRPLSITRLPVMVAIAFFIIWFAVLIRWPK
jgi:hypothetical protein